MKINRILAGYPYYMLSIKYNTCDTELELFCSRGDRSGAKCYLRIWKGRGGAGDSVAGLKKLISVMKLIKVE